jgi:ribosomal protein S18 acetylase RimI-like enzyme
MSVKFQLVPATSPAHYDAFKQLLQEYAERDLSDACNSTIWRDMAQLPGRYAPPEGQVLLAYDGDELAACGAYVATLTPGLAEVKRVYVRPAFRRQRLAQTLTVGLTEIARLRGYTMAGICTWPDNSSALALYQQLGFTPIASFREPEKAHLTFLGLPLAQPL